LCIAYFPVGSGTLVIGVRNLRETLSLEDEKDYREYLEGGGFVGADALDFLFGLFGQEVRVGAVHPLIDAVGGGSDGSFELGPVKILERAVLFDNLHMITISFLCLISLYHERPRSRTKKFAHVFAGNVLTLARMADCSPHEVGYKWNGLFSAVFLVGGFILLFVLQLFY